MDLNKIHPLDVQAMRLKKGFSQMGYYREMLECIYNLCLQFNQAAVKKTVPDKKAIEEGINCLDRHGIGTAEILDNEYQES